MNYELLLGNCLDKLKELEDNSIDSIVCDPPYGLSFMNKKWDYDVPSSDIWKECLRVLKPGGHLLAFAGTRTQHRMAVNIEDAGFEIRDMIAWVYGSGFPKSLDVSKAIDKAAGVEREVMYQPPATPEAQQWAGWGTALKPSLEPITMARKPLSGTVAANVLEHGTGAINVDGCRVEHVTVGDGNLALNPHLRSHINGGNGGNIIAHEDERRVVKPHASGRWPANLIHDGSDEIINLFPSNVKGVVGAKAIGKVQFMDNHNQKGGSIGSGNGITDIGSAARFFYCAKVSKKERGEGNIHPTVKPIDLMRYLCRLVTPPNGTVLDPFMGSGSTGIAALKEGFNFIGIEMEEEYYKIAEQRIKDNYIEDRFSEL